MNKIPIKSKEASSIQLQLNQKQLKTRFYLTLIFLSHLAIRFYIFRQQQNFFSSSATLLYKATLLIVAVLVTLFSIQLFIFSRLGTAEVKYTSKLDTIIYVLSATEWFISIYITLNNSLVQDNHSSRVSSILCVSSFVWRTLLQKLLVKQWYIRIITPVCAQLFMIGLTIIHSSKMTGVVAFEGLFQAIYIILIFYLADDLNINKKSTEAQLQEFKMTNELIYDTVSDGIAIINSSGEIAFINKTLKRFSKQFDCYSDDQLFTKITNLERQSELGLPSPLLVTFFPSFNAKILLGKMLF